MSAQRARPALDGEIPGENAWWTSRSYDRIDYRASSAPVFRRKSPLPDRMRAARRRVARWSIAPKATPKELAAQSRRLADAGAMRSGQISRMPAEATSRPTAPSWPGAKGQATPGPCRRRRRRAREGRRGHAAPVTGIAGKLLSRPNQAIRAMPSVRSARRRAERGGARARLGTGTDLESRLSRWPSRDHASVTPRQAATSVGPYLRGCGTSAASQRMHPGGLARCLAYFAPKPQRTVRTVRSAISMSSQGERYLM